MGRSDLLGATVAEASVSSPVEFRTLGSRNTGASVRAAMRCVLALFLAKLCLTSLFLNKYHPKWTFLTIVMIAEKFGEIF